MSRPTIYFLYTYNCGGLGDLIKGCSTVWYISQFYNYNFDIRFRHELGALYTTKFFRGDLNIINLIDKGNSEIIKQLNLNKEPRQNIGFLANTCLDFIKNPLDKTRPFLECVKPFMQDFYKTILPIKTLDINNYPRFNVLHCRMGDKYLNETTNKSDDRIGDKKSFDNKISWYTNNFTSLPTLVCSDSAKNIQYLLEKIPGSFSVVKTPYHFAYNTKKIPQREIIQSIEDTLKEHELISRGEHIFCFVYSGYPIISCVIGNKPLYILKDDGTGYEEFKNELFGNMG